MAELLRLVAFTDEAIEATVAAIVEHRGDDATRWTLDELHDVATDPTADVPALFRWRIGKGRHNPENDEKTTEKGMTSRLRRPLHDGGEAIRQANDEAAELRRSMDPSRLRDVARGMLTDRKPLDAIVEATGATLEQVEAIAAEFSDERTSDATRRSSKQVEADEVEAKVEAAVRIVETFTKAGRTPPPSAVQTLRNAGRWPQ